MINMFLIIWGINFGTGLSAALGVLHFDASGWAERFDKIWKYV